MAIYRFRVAFEDYDGYRDIDIRSNQTFEDLHYAIHQSIGYQPDHPSSFYVSNDQWHKGEELTIFPDERKKTAGVKLMSNARLSKFIEDPHQKFYYIFNFQRPLDFQVQLTKISIEEDTGITYPVCVKSYGEPPKQFVSTTPPPEGGDEFEDDDPGPDDDHRMEAEEFGIDQDEHETDDHDDGFEGSGNDEVSFGDSDEEDY